MVEFPAVTVSAVAQTANGFKVVHSWDFVYIFFLCHLSITAVL